MNVYFAEPPRDPAEGAKFLVEKFLPVFQEFWEKRGRTYYRTDQFDFQAADFTQMWLNKALILLLAEEAGEMRGFLLAAQLRPWLHDGRRLHVEAFYGRTPETEKALVTYLGEIFKYYQAEAVVIPRYDEVPPPEPWAGASRELSFQEFRR